LQSDDEEVLSAMAAALVGSIADFTAQTGNSEMRHAIIETEKGTIQFAEVGDLILIVKTNGTGNLGRVRTEMKRTSRRLSELVATY
jgi:predicted regulator of Ras-like GTPase activity (Roadblock/LC7/MglB family)